MYNHKNFKNIRLADTGTRDTVTDLASGLATGQIDEGVSKLVTKGVKAPTVKPGLNVGLMAAQIAADPLINLGEAHLLGPKKMYVSRMGDAVKNIAAIKRLIPNDPNLNALLDSLQQQINNGLNTFNTRKAYNNHNMKLATIGQANWGDYGRQTAMGAGFGAATGALAGGIGAIPGALVGGISGLLSAATGDIAYQFKNNSQKASWNAGEMEEKLSTMADQLQQTNPQIGLMLRKLGKDVKNYIEVNHEKKWGANTKNSYDEELQKMQQGQGQGQGQEQGQNMDASADPQISQTVQQLMAIYQQGMAYRNQGDAQNYNALQSQYNYGVQNLYQYIGQNYPNQDANTIINGAMQQMQQMQEQMQQPMNQQQGYNVYQPQ